MVDAGDIPEPPYEGYEEAWEIQKETLEEELEQKQRFIQEQRRLQRLKQINEAKKKAQKQRLGWQA